VLLITDPSFAAGVISQKNHVHGTLKGQGYSTVIVDYVQNEQKVEPGEQFFTSGDDRIFPKGLPVGEATVVREGKSYKEIFVTPSGLQNGLEEVLIVTEGVHVAIPDVQPTSQPIHLQEPPPAESSDSPTTDATPAQTAAPAAGQPPAPAAAQAPPQSGPLTTDADRLVDQYRKIGQAEKHVYGQSAGGAPNFNINLNPRPDVAPVPTGVPNSASPAAQSPASAKTQGSASPTVQNPATMPPATAAKNPAAKQP
jgi:rod shape-determining protein MreC